jgi:1-acyl-sn-glycerol-3-phosphate acyltransferase
MIRPDRRRTRERTTWKVKTRVLLASAASMLLLCFGALLMLLFGVLTGFQTRRICSEVLARVMARIALRFFGVRIIEHRDFPFPSRQTIYISNHTSALDMFVLISLGFPNCRYFLSGFLRKILPMWIIGWMIGIFWTAPQTQGKKRTKIFQNADQLLRRTGESVFLTPEGQITWVFNKGAFHLATSLKAKILPIYILIPNEVDPGPWTNGDGLDVRAGDVHVHYRPEIDTSSWSIEDIALHRDQVRSMYLEWAKELGESY